MRGSTSQDSRVGTTVGRRYRIVFLVGRGGMAAVYRATDEVLGRDVAVKVMHESLAADEAFVERFRREAQQAARLNHPNVVAVYDWDREAGTVFMVMELVEGTSLRDILERSGPLPLDVARHVVSGVAGALDHAHASGIVHRDVKPENILLAPPRSAGAMPMVKIADFGIAQALGPAAARLTAEGVIGSVSYIAPEQLQGGPVDARADVYALGLTAYEALTGRAAFDGSTAAEIAAARLSGSVPSPGISPRIDGAIARATARRPEDRFVTAGELAAALGSSDVPGELRDTLPGAALQKPAYFPTQVMPKSESPKKRGRRRWWIALVALLVGAAAATSAYVALAPRTTRVPDVSGMSPEGAALALGRSGLRAGPRVEEFADAEAGTVIGTRPGANAQRRRGDPVTLVVSKGPELLTVPHVVNKPLADAQSVLSDGGFVGGEVTEAHHATAPAGTVVSQSPAEGKARRGSPVALVVSKGPELVAVPKVAGAPSAEAKSALQRAGLAYKESSEFSEDVPAGKAVRTDPPEGRRVPKGSTVTVVVSRGPPAFEMPNLVGMTLEQAKSKASSLGLVVGNEYAVPGSGKPKGQVQGQNPAPGTDVRKGTKIDLYFAA